MTPDNEERRPPAGETGEAATQQADDLRPSVPESASFEVERIIAKLRDPDAVFTTSEVAYLMSRSGRWGYENRVDEENGAWPPPRVRVFGQWYDQAVERQRADAEVRQLVAQERGR